VFRRAASARYVGQSSEIEVRLPDDGTLGDFAEQFGAAHERNYGFRAPADEPVELMGLSVMGRGIPEQPRLPQRIPPAEAEVPSWRRAWFPEGGWTETEVLDRADLARGARHGPLIVQEYDATCLVPDGWTASVDGFGNISLAVSPSA
jgi:N-methylhydantoinase A